MSQTLGKGERRGGWRVAGVIALVVGALACGGGRNTAGGNSDYETLMSSCAAGDWTLRLYQGNAGATTAYWYSVTAEQAAADERQVFFSYGWPAVDQLRCSPTRVELVEGEAVVQVLEASQLPALRREPVSLWKGERR